MQKIIEYFCQHVGTRRNLHTYIHTHTGKPCQVKKQIGTICLMLISLFISPVFATEINNPATCDSGTLSTDTGPTNLRANYESNTLNLRWYDDDNNRINVSSTSSDSCTYGGTINLPTPPTKKGYTFKGWKVIQDYTPIQYLQSTGYQSIDTEYVPTAGTKMEIRVQFLYQNRRETCTCGTAPRGDEGYNSYFSPLCFIGNYNIYYYFNSYHGFTGATATTNDTVTASIDVNNANTSATIVYHNETTGQQLTTTQSGRIQTTSHIKLFSGNANANNTPTEFSKMRLYYAKIWQDGVLVRNFIPVLDIHGVPCVYDTISGNFYYNNSYNYFDGDEYRASFIAGPNL